MRPLNSLICFLLIVLLILAPVTLIRRYMPPNSKPLSNIPITLFAKDESKIYHSDLESYLIGVVAAEMPANFELATLKAQAVAARTITIQRLKRFGGRGCKHYSGVDFCDDPSESQAWQSLNQLKAKWGQAHFREYYNKVSRAVRDTAGIILIYNRKPIDAVFHSTCGVGTADSSEVWQHNVPYLRSVDCGFDQQAPRYISQVEFRWNDLASSLQIPISNLKNIRVRQRSSRGRVLNIVVGKYLFTGEQFRKALSLNSSCFTCTQSGNGIIFKTIGYGHGVGMCQYGANGMAKQGYSYQQILRHYYQGIQFCKIKE